MRGFVSIDRPREGKRRFWWRRLKPGLAVLACMPVASVAHAVSGTNAHQPVELAWVRLEGAEVCPPAQRSWPRWRNA